MPPRKTNSDFIPPRAAERYEVFAIQAARIARAAVSYNTMGESHMMKKFVNAYDDVVREALEGFTACFSQEYRLHPEVNGVLLRQHRKGKVALIVGGGSGHEPMFSGFVGKGLADAAACGNIFASPDPGTVYKTAKAVQSGAGVLFVYGNYAGDNLNFDMAEDMLETDGIPAAHVRVWDDCVSAPIERLTDRRGIAGDLFVIKVAGAACDAGLSLEEVVKVSEHARDSLRSIGVAVTSAHIPGAAEPIFTLADDEMEYGMGIHGEKGIQRAKLASADEVTDYLYSALQKDRPLQRGDEVCVLINGLGSTTLMEMSIVYRRLKQLLDRDGIVIHDSDMNSYCTTLEMGGFSISLLRLDETLKPYIDAPCASPYYTRGVYVASGETEEVALEAEEPEGENRAYDPAAGEAYIAAQKIDPEALDFKAAKAMLLSVADAVVAAEPMLTKVDSAIGDGDHGIGMKGGLKKAHVELLKLADGENAYQPFSVAGNAMLMSMGGASGVIFGSMFMAGAKNREKAVLSAQDLAQLMHDALDAIQARGHAQVGDKTMVDALAPAVAAMEQNAEKGMVPMLRAGEAAALSGVEYTKQVEAKFGRAKTQRSTIGLQDAGATSVWVILKAMADFLDHA